MTLRNCLRSQCEKCTCGNARVMQAKMNVNQHPLSLSQLPAVQDAVDVVGRLARGTTLLRLLPASVICHAELDTHLHWFDARCAAEEAAAQW